MALNPRDTNMFQYDKQARALQAPQDQANQQASEKPSAVLDGAIDAIKGEVARYENGLYQLIEKLEAPNPQVASECQPVPQACTVEGALREIHTRMHEATDTLNTTRKRIEEQVGELKILP